MQLDELYGLPPERFIDERGVLVKALRADGRREEAAAIARLRRPSVAAWAVNQLVRDQGAAVQELFESGDALRAAQADLLAGRGEARALHAAGELERAAVEGLVALTRGLLDRDGRQPSAAVLERVGDTLHAAALDEASRERVSPGRLERELRHVGLGLGEGELAPAEAPDGGVRKAKRGERDDKARRRAEAEHAERERVAARTAARVAASEARRRLERAQSAQRSAEQTRERAAGALEQAQAALATAREEAGGAAEAYERARAALDDV